MTEPRVGGPNMYFCPLCNQTKWHTKLGLENHIWQEHNESKCCTAHRSDSTSTKVKSCHGKLDMATCASKAIYQSAGHFWPPEPRTPVKNTASVDPGVSLHYSEVAQVQRANLRTAFRG